VVVAEVMLDGRGRLLVRLLGDGKAAAESEGESSREKNALHGVTP
jgi:hypothetical protein